MAAEFYNTSYSSTKRKKGGNSFLGLLADSLFFVVTIGVVALFLITLFIPTINPHKAEELSTIGLVAPFVYVAVLFLTLYWIMRWRVWIAVPMIILAMCGLPSLSSFYKMELRRSYDEPFTERDAKKKYGNAVKVMTYNVRSFIDDNGERCIDSIAKMVKTLNPDILCFQEMGFSEQVDSMLMPLNPMPRTVSRNNLSPAIYSKYPIIKAGRMDSIHNLAWADVVMRDDTVRVFSLHLQTTNIRRDDSEYIESHDFLEEADTTGKLRSMISRLSENNILRANQVDTISNLVASSPYPVIVCGDFNDTPISYTYRTMSRKMTDAFREVGRGYSHTYRGFFNMLRIDYVLCSEEFVPLSYEVIDSWGLVRAKRWARDTVTYVLQKFGHQMPLKGERIDMPDSLQVDNRVLYSDHYPVFVRLRYDGKNN
ncbi:MAG: endonuclease/exonuclease/phosphatase family protein [Alistipes sp.]|nr:endonuclease/exonuclease/phosphatase family protein [Alistipes sp.]